jgi:purine-nucleoside phosphorylase
MVLFFLCDNIFNTKKGNSMATAHISASKGEIAKTMVMVGDPLRAKMIATTFLKDAKEINNVRGMLGYTGTFEGKQVTVMGHGMGISSIGIYAYELFDIYGVESIIRAGSCGSFKKEIELGDIIIQDKSYTDSINFGEAYGEKEIFNFASKELMAAVKESKESLNLETKIHEGNIMSSQ